jgi:hypothetical protein
MYSYCIFINNIEAATIFPPVQNAIGFHLEYDASLGPPVSDVVVDLKSGHMYASECKNIISYLLHLLLFKSQVKRNAAMDEMNQLVEHKL